MQIVGSKMEQWSENMESATKDVECTFDILKKRFLFLKNPIKIHLPEKIKDAFKTCAAIHNWLHKYDGWDNWEGRAGVVHEDDISVKYDHVMSPIGLTPPLPTTSTLTGILQEHRQEGKSKQF